MPREQRYRTIVADPPWAVSDYGARTNGNLAGNWREHHSGPSKAVPYERMSVESIAAHADRGHGRARRSPLPLDRHGPYLELFARRQRLGWDTWGNEALEHVALSESPNGA